MGQPASVLGDNVMQDGPAHCHNPGHPGRGHEDRSENVLRSLIGGNHPAAVDGLELLDEIDGLE